MILSVSRRTDIPAFYAEWFYNRIKEGYVCIRDMKNEQKVSRINLSPDVIDGIVFWTKNPYPLMGYLDALKEYPYYFQFTLNPYGKDIEPNTLSTENRIAIFQNLASVVGKERVIWRYDPILLYGNYDIAYHIGWFRYLASRLSAYTEKCTVSFIDIYGHVAKNTPFTEVPVKARKEMIQALSDIAKEYGIYIDTCAERGTYPVPQAHCIDKERLERIGKYRLDVKKDKGQRSECKCIGSIDIGMYNTCKHGCRYCYASWSQKPLKQHDPFSPFLIGQSRKDDIIQEKDVISYKSRQLSLFDL